tara:strand:+ start:11170 stop:11400 length:231 start_codon:yes stop_codon:yes gene_type:complete
MILNTLKLVKDDSTGGFRNNELGVLEIEGIVGTALFIVFKPDELIALTLFKELPTPEEIVFIELVVLSTTDCIYKI